MSILSKIFGEPIEKSIVKYQAIVGKINQLESQFESFSAEKLKQKTIEFQERLKKGAILDDLLTEAFAAVREAAKRTIGQRHFDVQLIGGMVLHEGKIAEMKTGEGKTLAATLAVYLNALEGKGAHVVTVNDYLAKRDTNWMGPIYHFLGLSVGCLEHEKAYLYEPAVLDENEVTVEMQNLKEVGRAEAYAADITYGTNNEFGFDYLRDNMVGDSNEASQRTHHFAIVDEVDSILIDEARTPLIISAPDADSTRLYQTFAKIVPQLKENIHYNIDEKMRAATLTEEGVAKVEKILGMDIYNEGGIRYVHHLEQALRSQALFKRDRDYVIKDGEVIIVDDFTGRLMFGRRYSEGLHQAIEAKEGVRVQQESRTLATITFQNYFRLYKKLAGMTGTAATSAEEFAKVYNLEVVVVPTNKLMIRADLPDNVYRTEQGKFQAVVRTIKECHEKGQPVLVGTVSIEKNELLSALLKKEGISHELLNAKNHEREAQIIAKAGEGGAVTVATNMAGRGVDIILGGRIDAGVRQSEHDKVVASGGLHIIGTERHEARRIDNQLRGRAGRQGDPGSSQFFVSLEDDLMRIFGSERIKRMMETLKVPEDQPIANKIISRAIESAQAKIEGFNFDARKHVLEYDDVMNKQREIIYKKRKEILDMVARQSASGNVNFSQREKFTRETSSLSALGGTVPARRSNVPEADLPRPIYSSLKEQILEMIGDEIKKIVEFHTQENRLASPDPAKRENLQEIGEVINTIFPLSNEASNLIKELKSREEIIKYLIKLAQETYEVKEKEIGSDNMRQIEKFVLLRTIDMLWMDHLDEMEHLRDSVRLRAYGQRDPLVEYKNEGFRLFQRLLESIQSNVVGMIYKVAVAPAQNQQERIIEQRGNITSAKTSAKIGRNDPCWCGSGKKFKKCHGQ